MKRIISLFSLFILLFVNIVTPVTYAMDGEDSSSESVSESTESSVDTDNSVGGGDDSSDTDASDDVASDEGTEPDADSESAEDTDADVTDEESSDEEGSDSTEGEELEESLENSASGSTDGDTSEEEVSAEEEIELLCKQEGAPENAHYISSDEDASDVSCKWECDNHYAISEDGLSCTLVEEGLEDVVTDSKGNSEEVKSCEIPENAQKIENSNLTGEKCEWECSQGYLITKAGDACEEINFSKYKNEPSVAALCQRLGLDWEADKGDLAKLAGIEDYLGTREQNESIRLYIVDHVEEILKGKFDLQAEVVEKNKGFVYSDNVVLNAEEITGESKYQNITVNVLAPVGSFPEGTTLSINPITKKKELKEIENQIVDQQNNVDEALELLAFDISFFYDEKEVQPVEGKTVQVTFDYEENKKLSDADTNEEQELKVYHLDDKDANGNKVEEIEVKEVVINENESEEGKVVVDANGFSVYVIIKVNTTADTVTITYDANGGTFGNSTTKEVSYNKNGNVFEIASFPGAPYRNSTDISVQSGWMFVGWYTEPEATTEWLGQASDTTGNMIVYAKWLPFNDIEIKGATIMDRNLGATTTGAGPNAPKDSYGYYFQWGNNHGFVKNSNNSNIKNSNTVSTQKDVTGYGPDKYYYSTDISNQLKWTETQGSQNLWGNDGTELERQGPCPKGYHISKRSERYTVIGTDVSVLPMAGYMHYNGEGSNQQPYISSSHYAYLLSTSQGAGYGTWSYNGNNKQDNRGNGYGGNIRCFKNTTPLPEIPEVEEENTTWEKNSETVMPEEGTTITFDDEEGLSGAALTGVKLNVESHTSTNDITITLLDLGVTTIDEILGEVELKFNKTDNSLINKTAKFNKAVKVKIPVRNGINGKVKVRIKHGTNPFGFTGLALSEVECNDNGTPKTNPYNGGLLNAPTNGFVEIYTCSASTLAVTDVAAFAAIGDNGYETLAEAIAAVPTDGTQTEIVLLKDETINETLAFNDNKNILLNLSGHTLNNNGFTYILNGRLEVKDGILGTRVNVYGYEDSSMTSYLKVDDDAILEGDYPIILREYNGGDKAYGAIIDVQGNINATNTALWVMGNIKQGDSVIDIHGILTGTNVGVAQNGYSTVNVHTGASIYAATETAFEQRAGITNIYGGTLKSDGTPESEEANNNGTTTVGAAFAVSPYNLSNQTINIEGGTFEAINALLVTNKTSSATALEDNVQIEVKGGNYIGNVVSKNPLNAENPLEDFISGGTFNQEVAENLCVEGYYPEDNGDGTYGIIFGIAKIGTKVYESLEEAIADADAGTAERPTTIQVLADFDFTTINTGKYIKLDLGDKVINGGLDLYNGFVTIANGTLKREGKTVVWVETSRDDVENYNKLTVADNAKLQGDYTIILNSEDPDKSKGYGANIEIRGDVEGSTAALWVMGNIKQGNGVINIYGSLTGGSVGIAQNGYATVNVHTGATIYAQTETAFEQRAGITNIYGGTLKSDGTPASEEANNNGTTTVGAAFAVSPYNLSDQTINIEGGTFEAINALIITNETSAASALQNRVTIGVEGGTFKGNVVSKNPVEGGDPIENFIEGGTFSKRPATEYCGDGLIPAQNPNGTYGVKLGWKVTFKDGNETYVWPVVDGERISAATVTPEEGYVFDGWYESGATTSFNFNSLITRDINLESVWKVNVTFNSNGGSSVPTQTIKQGGTVTEPQNPEKAGYNFINWTKDDVAYGFDSPVSEPITLDANWNAISGGTAYTVIHQTRNENSPTYTQRDTVQEYGDAGTAVNPENIYKPNYEGYVFDRCDSVNIAGESTTVVRCYYELLNHNVEFYDDGNNEYAYDGSYKTVPNYGKIKKPEDPTKENDVEHTYSFVGWYETGATTAYDFDTIQTGANSGDVKTIKLYAKFDSLNKYTVSFYDEDGTTSLATTTVDSGEIAIYPNANPTKENTAETGYIFTGWYLSGDTNKTKVNLSSTVVLGNTEYIALYDEYVQEYTVSYAYVNKPYGASDLPAQETYKYGQLVTITHSPTAQGFTFTGWFLDNELTGEFTMPARNIVLTGEFLNDNVIYKYHYQLEDLNGGWDVTGDVVEKNGSAGTKVAIPDPLPTFIGFTLTGTRADYLRNINGDGTTNVPIKYERNKYKLNYEYENHVAGESELPTSGTYKYEASVQVAPLATASGYDFEWSGYTANSTIKMPAKDLTIKGVFTPRNDTKYQVRYYFQNLGDDDYSENKSIRETPTGETDTTANANTKREFSGFTFNPNIGKLSGKIYGSGSLKLKVYYTRDSYTITFSGSDVDPITAKYQSGVVLPSSTKTGYSFNGWIDENDNRYSAGDTYTIPGNVTLTADWKANNIQYRFMRHTQKKTSEEYHDSIKTGTYLTGTIGGTVDIPLEYTGLTLSTGDTLVSGGIACEVNGDVCQYTIPDDAPANLDVHVYYKRNLYTVSFDTDGGNDIAPITAKYKANITLPAPIKTGYNFVGWGESFLSGSDKYQVIDNITLTGHWLEKTDTKYTVEYYQQNIDNEEYSLYETGDNLSGTTNSTATAEIKNYSGFTLNQTGSDLTGTITASGDLVLKLYYDRNSYNVSYALSGIIPEGVDVPTSGEVKYGATVTVNRGLNAEGYTFTGWFLDDELTGSFVMPANDVVLTGEFTPDDVTYKYHYELEDLNGTFVETGDAIIGTGKTGDPVSIALPLPTFTGFTFSGDASDDTGTIISGDGKTDVAIRYTRNSYKVKYGYDNYEALTSIPTPLPHEEEYKYEAPVLISDAATATGYKFLGWSGYTEGDTISMPANDIIITGSFTGVKTTYTVSYYYQANDGEYYLSGSVERAKKTDTIAKVNSGDKVPSDAQHFAYYKKHPDTVLSGTVKGDGSLDLKVYFKGLYSVTYQPGDHGAFSEVSTTGLNRGVNTPSYQNLLNYHEQGYIFSGWSPEWTGKVTGDVVYVAEWTPSEATYTVEHYLENLNGEYEVQESDTETISGTTKDIVTAVKNTYTGFTYTGDISTLTGEVKGDGSLVLKLYYVRDSYSLTYQDPNGNDIEEDVKYGADIPTETSSYEGYEFSGFVDAPTDGKMPATGLTLTPIWNLINYNVTFDANGGDSVDAMTYTIKSGIDSLPTPVWTGYEFTGWYTGDTKVVSIATGSTGDVSLTAHWDAKVVNYTVKHYREVWEGYTGSNGNTGFQAEDNRWYYEYTGKTLTGHVNDDVSVTPFAPTSGFTYNEEAPNVTSGTLTATGLELKLYYKRNNYIVSFDSNGGSAVDALEVGYYLTGEKPSDPTRTGYVFSGWTLGGDTFNFKKYRVKNNIELTAEWTPNNIQINLDPNGASGTIDTIFTDYETEITLSTGSELSKTGHNFMGWSTTSTGDVEYAGGEVVSGLVDTGSITLYAIWTPKKYDITFVDEDGTTVLGVFSGAYGEDPASFWKEDPTQSSANWKCQFKGWSPTPAAITGEATYKATFYSLDDNNPDLCSLASYTVTWKNDDGTEIKSDGHIGFGSTPSYSGAVPQKTGDEQYSYIFSGWTPAITKVTGDVEYTAEYTAVLNKYDVTWNNWDGTEIKVDTGIDYGTTLEFSGEVPQRTGDNIYSYVFSGWTPSVHAITGDTVYQAEFKSTFTPYTITWSGNNDNNLTNIEVLQVWHSYVKVQPNPERTGYVFSGWTPEVISGTSIVEGDQTYLAQWTPATGIEYKVKHYLQELDGSYPENPKDTDTLSGTTEKLTNAVEKSYSGFSLSGNIKQQQIKADGSTVVSVYYKRDSYKIEFSSDGGTTVAEQTVLYEKSGSKPEDPKKTGYTFSGWTMNGIPYDFTAPVTGNITLTGTWTPNVYTVKFDANKGTGTAIDDMDFTYDVAQNLPDSTFTRKYYSFSGWNTEADGSGSGYNSGESVSNLTAISGDVVTLYAQWLGKSYVVIFSGNGATSGEMEDQEFEFGKTEPLNENKFEKEGYHFIGWRTDPTTGKLYEDKISYPTWTKKDSITLYAQWQINHPSIIFDTVGGTEIDSISGDYNTPITATRPTPIKTGFVFGGWDKEIPTTMPAEDMTITAKWLSTEWSIDEKVSPHGEGENGKGYDTEISGYDIKYTNVSLRIPNDDEDRGGKTATWLGFKLTAPEAVTAKNNSGAAYLKTYSNTKYTIAQATYETDSDGRYVVYVWMPLTDEDVKSAISGEKTEIEYTTIVSWDGNEESEKTIKATVDLKSLLLKDKDGTTVLVETDTEGNIVDKNEYYDVTFDTNGGSSVTGQNVHYNSGVVIPAEPTKTGYQFSGWTMDGTVFDFTGSKITGDIILTGVWTPITYKINYVVNGGENKSGNATTYTIEDTVPLYNTAIRTGYVFKGWLDADLGIVKKIEKGTTGDRNLLAQWQQVDAALAEAKSGEKKAVVSSDVTVDVDAAPGTAEYTGNIPAGTSSFGTPLLTNVVNSGTIEEYSLVGIKRASTQLDVKTDELQVKTGYVATIVGGLEVYLKKITITKNASGVIETKTEKNTNTVNFSKPVALPINITTSATGVKVMVNHGEGYGLSGLSINPNTTCTNGIASDPYTGELIPVENSYAWIYTCSASKFVAYTETVKSSGGGSSGGSSSGGSGGGGGGSSKSSSSSSSSSTTPTTNTGNTTNIDLKGVVSAPNKACLNITEESKIKYSDEVLDAYAWAYANGVVTSNDVEKARVYSYITRAELAKIMVQYVAGVLKKKPVVEGNVSYADVDESLGEYAGYINLAYQYQIMGINADGTPLKEFGPKSLVTRAEFASVLSRVLYGDKYNVDGSAFYSMHIDVLNQLGIIKDTNPAILEKIGWILIMLKRASKDIPNTKDVSNVEYCPITSEDEQKAAYEWALKYGITSIDDPDKARLGEELTRAEFAKMMVQYMINVLHKRPILNKDISYPDVDGSLGDLEAYIKLAYQYQIMGIHGNGQPLEEFAPNRIVTRKEFATVFSRILFGDRFNIDGPEYWTNHIDALKEISVLKDGNPALQEVRGRVMLMMYRSADDLNK